MVKFMTTQEVLDHVKKTLDIVSSSGLKDFVEGGFYRYTVDNEWKVPHFEKMLYDQAQLISLYSKAYKVFSSEDYKNIINRTVNFLNNNMLSEDGLFFAAMDADTDGEEGKYYSFDYNELLEISSDSNLSSFLSYFNIDIDKPWENNKYLLMPNNNDNWLEKNKISEEELNSLKSKWINNILKIKKSRTKPRIDDKIIVSWNALAVIGLVDAYEALKDKSYLDQAKQMFSELKDKSFRRNKLVHTFKENQFQEGVLEDYAFFKSGYEIISGNWRYLLF